MSNSTPKQKAASKSLKTKKAVTSTASKIESASKTTLKSEAPSKPVATAKKSSTKSKTTKPKATLKSVNTALKKPTNSAPTTSNSSPTTLKSLHSSIADIETRMKRADTLTRKSVTALETAVTALDSRSRQKSTSDKAALTRKVNQLSSRLTEMVEQTQNSVNSELKTALSNPSVENLKSALSRADQRLSQAETLQADAIAKINRHLASIATAVDARIAQEETARVKAIDALKTETIEKIETVEQDTASALGQIGDKIIELSDEIKRRSEAGELSIREKVSEIAQQTQTEFEHYRTDVEIQIENVAKNVSQADTGETRKLERTIFSLTNRLEELENSVADISMQALAPPPAPAPVVAPAAIAEPPKLSVVKTMPVTASVPDAFTPIPQTTQAIPPNPYSTAQAVQNVEPQTLPVQDHHIPQEFDPRHFMRAPGTEAASAQFVPEQSLAPPAIENVTPAPAAKTRQTQSSQNLSDLPPQPYSNPAYAEQDDTMENIRIGGSKAETTFKPPKLSGRNLRVAALATGVAVIGLVGAKGFLSNNDDIKAPQFTQKESVTTPANIPQTGAPVVIEPIGNYADNKAATVTGEAANTLNSAAGAGDPVAQFQLGLSYLEQGRTNEGVDLIRKSANQNQPAAQYRLAKLYEVGEGVTQDSNMARQLTERAARNGNRIAMHDLALYYAEGRGGITAELPTAAKWFEKAAERGVVDSQFNLGVLFESGQGLPKSMTDAFVWYSIAATQGDQFAKKRIDVLSDTMPAEDLSAAQTRIAKFKPVKIDEVANGIFRNVAWAKPDDSSEKRAMQVKEVQSLLSELGYDIGGADGSMGPRTRSAIISFEQANGLPETGRVNTALLDRLELAAGA